MNAPVVLFVYNRPEHTKKTVESLRNNFGASDTVLYIFSDAPRCQEDEVNVGLVRDYIKCIVGFKEVIIAEQVKNLGLADSIIGGVRGVCEKHGRVIVLEDDIVTSKYFLDYMNEALDRYSDEERIMHISGYMFPINTNHIPESFLFRATTCWGWATWARAWKFFDRNTSTIEGQFTKEKIYSFNIDGCNDFWSHIKCNIKGEIKTWAIFWYATVFLNGGLCLHPAKSYVLNIGHDQSGVNCKENSHYEVELASGHVQEWPEIIQEDPIALDRIKKYHKKINSVRYRIYNKIIRILIKQPGVWKFGIEVVPENRTGC